MLKNLSHIIIVKIMEVGIHVSLVLMLVAGGIRAYSHVNQFMPWYVTSIPLGYVVGWWASRQDRRIGYGILALFGLLLLGGVALPVEFLLVSYALAVTGVVSASVVITRDQSQYMIDNSIKMPSASERELRKYTAFLVLLLVLSVINVSSSTEKIRAPSILSMTTFAIVCILRVRTAMANLVRYGGRVTSEMA